MKRLPLAGRRAYILDSSLECADWSALYSLATWRDHVKLESVFEVGVKPPQAKAVTGHRTPKS